MKKLIAFFLLNSLAYTALAQAVINNKGTKITIDSSKWKLSGIDIYNKNAGNVGIGTSTPTNKLEIKQGTAGKTGLTFTNVLPWTVAQLNTATQGATPNDPAAATASNTSAQSLTVDAIGRVILSSGFSYINTQAGAYTLTAADNQAIVYITSATAVTITVPATLPAGFTCAVIQGGLGQITFTGIQNAFAQNKTVSQWASVTIQTPVAGTNVLSGETN